MKMLKVRPLFYLVAVVLFFASCNEDKIKPELKGHIKGQVVDAETFAPIENANIYTKPATNSMLSDANGEFLIANIDTGTYRLTADRHDYQINFSNVRVNRDDTTQVTITLQKEDEEKSNEAPFFLNQFAPASGSYDMPLTVSLHWAAEDPDGDGLLYDVTLYKTDQLSPQVVAENLTDTTYTLEGLDFNTVYYWELEVSDSSGAGEVSPLQRFKTHPLEAYEFLYARKKNGNYEIFAATLGDEDTSYYELAQLTDNNFRDWAPKVSPNKRYIAYVSDSLVEPHIFIMRRDGSDKQRVTPLAVSGYHNYGNAFCWSHDGGQLIYSHYNKLYQVNWDGSDLTELAVAPPNRHFREVSASPDGEHIVALTIGSNSYDNDILLYTSEGELVDTLYENTEGKITGPSFDVDGESIIFTHDESGVEDLNGRQLDAQIFRLTLESRDTTALSANKATGTNDLTPHFSPTGASIIFSNQPNDASSPPSIYIMSNDGSNREELAPEGYTPWWL